jgi:hypothetical protein
VTYLGTHLRLAQRSREVILRTDEGTASDGTTYISKEGDKKRCKQCLQGAATTTGHDDGNNGEASDFVVMCTTTSTHSKKHQARPPANHFKRLLMEACPNHTYPIRHNIMDCDMMRSFMTLWM